MLGDPGWNDPPMLNYNASNPPPKSRIGNKRVAFPLHTSGNTSTSGNATTILLPNIPPPIGQVRLSQIDNDKCNNSSSSSSSTTNIEQWYEKTAKNLEEIMSTATRNEDMTNKIRIMLDMWRNDRLSFDIQQLIYRLSNYLMEKNPDKAKECELNLMMNHAQMCSSWIPGLRYLIDESRK